MYDVLFLAYPLIDITVAMNDTLPLAQGQTKLVTSMSPEPGGGANILFMATRLGLGMIQVGTVGQDDFGALLLRKYGEQGVETRYIETLPDIATQAVVCLNDKNGNHAFASMVDGRFTNMPFLDGLLADCRAVCLSGYMLADGDGQTRLPQLARDAAALGKLVFFDPGPLFASFPPGSLEEVLAATDVLVLNHTEAAGITGLSTEEAAAERLAQTVRRLVVVKSGAKGCYLYTRGQGTWHPGFSVPLVDTTGAGDSFLGAFMRGYIDGWDLPTVCRLANAAGAAKTQKPGCGTQVPTLAEVTQILTKAGHSVTAQQILDRHTPLRLG